MSSAAALIASVALLTAPATPIADSESPPAIESGAEVPSDEAPTEPAAQDPVRVLDEQVLLLEEAYHAVALDRAHHERLIEGYQRAIRRAQALGAESQIDRLMLGLARAAALALEQVGREPYRDLLAITLDDLAARIACRETNEENDALELEEARLLRKRHVPSARREPTCAGPVAEPVAEPPSPRPSPPPPDVSRSARTRDLVLVGVGGSVFAGGLVAMMVGALGKTIAQRSGRLLDPPTPEQQEFLDKQLPRRRAVWMSVGSAAIAAGIGMLIAGGVLLARDRRATRGTRGRRAATALRGAVLGEWAVGGGFRERR